MLLLAVPPPVFADELSGELPKSTRDILDEGGTDLSDAARWRFSDLCDTVGAWAAEGLQPALHLAAQSAGYLLLAGLLLAAGLPLILPQMNARSLYLAGMLAFACAGSARRLAIAGVLELISLCSYMEAIFNCTIIPMNVLSLMAIACATVILLELLDKLGIKGALSRESNA